MASKLTKWINNQLKMKDISAKEAKKDAGKYKSIAAAKKAGSLYYTDKNGKVQAAVYAEDLKKPIRPKAKPKDPRATRPKQPKGAPKKDNIITSVISDTKGGRGDTGAIKRIIGLAPGKKKPSKGSGRGDGMSETVKRKIDPKSPSALKSQSAKFNTFFKKNKSKYKKEGGGFNMRQAQKDFAKTQKK